VFRSPDDEESGPSIRTGPDLLLRDRTGDLDWSARYNPRYENFFTIDGADSTDHFFVVDGTWSITDRDELSLTNDFSYTQNIFQRLSGGGLGAVTPGQLDIGRQSQLQNLFSTIYKRHLTPLWTLESTVSNSYYDPQDDLSPASFVNSGSAQITRPISARSNAGVGISVTRQDFEDTEFRPGEGTTYYQSFGIWTYALTPRMSFSLSGGPAWVAPDAIDAVDSDVGQFPLRNGTLISTDGCVREGGTAVLSRGCQRASIVRFPSGTPVSGILIVDPSSVPRTTVRAAQVEPDATLTFYGRTELTRRGETWDASIGYERSSSAASGLGTSTDVDTVSAKFGWTPSPLWVFDVLAVWEMQKSSSQSAVPAFALSPTSVLIDAQGNIVNDPAQAAFRAPDAAEITGFQSLLVDDAFQTISYLAQVRALRRISKRTSLVGAISWLRQEPENDFGSTDSIDSLRVEFGVTWSLDPIHL
jgi:hypothetical protein